MRRESPRPPARRARALASPALPARPRRVARRLSLFRVRLGGAGLPRTGRAQRPCGTRHRLLTSHLERHVSVRPGALAPAWRSLLAGVRAAEPLRADGAAGNPARAMRELRPRLPGRRRVRRLPGVLRPGGGGRPGVESPPIRGGPAARRSCIPLDDGLHPPHAVHRDLRWNHGDTGLGMAGRYPLQPAARPGRRAPDRRADHGPHRLSGLVPGGVPGGHPVRGPRQRSREIRRRPGSDLRVHAGAIAIAYHLAHYLSFLLIQGQLIIPLASDPFGVGWNLFGTAGYRTNIGAVGARFAWLTAVIAIVAGHIIAVYLAHVLAMVALGGGARALRSQYPVTALMVGYTMVSLWILAQPIVESGLRSSAEERPGGLRVVRVERTARTLGELRLVQETPVIEVYLTAAAGTAEDAAALAPPWSTLPWELVVLMEETVSRGWAAFSREAAASRGVEWLDLVRAAGLKERMAGLAQELERRAYVPESLREMVTPAEARERWAALRAFYAARGHWLVTNGPYILARWTADSAVLEVFRDLSYPLGVGSFDAYAIPRRAYVSRIELAEGRLTITADIDELEKFGRSYNLVRTPFRPGASTSMRADVVAARYLVIGPGGHVVKTGTVPPGPDAVFRADLAGTLPAGRYALLVALSLNENAVAPDIRRLEYVVPDHPR